MIVISSSSIEIVTGIIVLIGTIFTVFFYFQKPQIALEKRVATLEDTTKDQAKQINAIRDDHSKSTESMLAQMKDLTISINSLNVTVGKLETKIDERIPKAVQPQIN